MELRPEEITKVIRSKIKNYEAKLEQSETGVVILVGDGIARVSGLEKCMAGELIEMPNDPHETEEIWDYFYESYKNNKPYPIPNDQALKVVKLLEDAKIGTEFAK